MATACTTRLLNDLKSVNDNAPEGVSGAPRGDNLMPWDANIFWPSGTPWEDGIFKLTLEFKQDYPNTPPRVVFVSNMFHPNDKCCLFYGDGGICLDILKNKWSPAYDVAAVLTSIQSVLCDPNPDSPANEEAAKLYLQDRKEYKRRVRKVVEESLLKIEKKI